MYKIVGLILNDIGMYEIMSKLMERYIEPLVHILYEQEPVACGNLIIICY